MKYSNIVQAEFIERPNRFIAYVNVDGHRERVHIKNTGRCRELLTKGACVYLERSDRPGRSTAYDLVAVRKGERLINMDSQAPNKVVEEWLHEKALFPDLKLVKRETKYGSSRFDFYVEAGDSRIFIEVKGVTLEKEGVVYFPDAPSERAVKHMEELVRAKKDGCRAFVLFVVQMEGVEYFTPNRDTHAAFAEALAQAAGQGVELLAYDCRVTPESLALNRQVPIILEADAGKGEPSQKEMPQKKPSPKETSQKETSPKETSQKETSQKEISPKETSQINPSKLEEYLPNLKERLRLEGLLEIPEILLKWYDKHKRILPWREEPTPYRVWVSEIMLQQTRVEAAKPYFERFMEALPDIPALAGADEETLLKLWEGLGYYNRARNLQKAAVRIMEEYGGQMPGEYEELLKLEGIGSYTAGAISSIAYGKVRPAVDGNVLRVAARLRKDIRLISDAKVKKELEQEILCIMPEERPGDFNQAMMEIGACVCIPGGTPRCGECPLERICAAHREGCEANYPKKAPPKPRKIEEKTVLVIRDAGRAAIRRRADRGLLAGMYEFPSLQGFHTAEEVKAYLAGEGIQVLRIQPLGEAKHIFTHREWHMKGYMVRVDELAPGNPGEDIQDWIYIEPGQARDRYPIPAAFGAYTRYLDIRLGQKKYREEE